MINIKELRNSELIMDLYNRYYVNDNIPDYVSSHWKYYGQKIKVEIDNDGNLKQFSGYGFGDLQPNRLRHKILSYLLNLSYYITLPYKKDIKFISKKAKVNLKAIGSHISYDCFRQICSLCVIRKHLNIKDDERFNVLIIGDGYGFLSSLLKSLYPESTIVLVDIGKVLLFQAVNLQRIFPDEDLIYSLPEDIEKIIHLRYKLIINSCSMMEMNYPVIKKYFGYIRRYATPDNLFYCCNRKLKVLPDGKVIEFLKYPWVSEDRHLVDEPCHFIKYFFSYRPPFIQRFDGVVLHRLTNMKRTT